jgi:hypothetical protein
MPFGFRKTFGFPRTFTLSASKLNLSKRCARISGRVGQASTNSRTRKLPVRLSIGDYWTQK